MDALPQEFPMFPEQIPISAVHAMHLSTFGLAAHDELGPLSPVQAPMFPERADIHAL